MSKTKILSVQGVKSSKSTLTSPGTEAPEGLHVQLLDAGTGPEIEAGDTISTHYLGQSWDGVAFDNSYDQGRPLSFRVGVGEMVCGWDDGLVGQRVGFRVLLSIPAELGYGDHGVLQAGIKDGATPVFVIEILGIAWTAPSLKPAEQVDSTSFHSHKPVEPGREE